jgi:uncharacterized membrane protein YdjX (TVP38/TMEM64 family)
MEKFLALFKSRKFWAAIVAVLVVVLRAVLPDFPLTDEQVGFVILTLVGYIIGVALDTGPRPFTPADVPQKPE